MREKEEEKMIEELKNVKIVIRKKNLNTLPKVGKILKQINNITKIFVNFVNHWIGKKCVQSKSIFFFFFT